MVRQLNYVRRRARGGRGLIPPNPKQWDNEHNGLDLRDALGLSPEVRLQHERAFELLPNVGVVAHGAVPMAQEQIEHFRGAGSAAWSGIGIPLPDGGALVVFNDSHPPNRIRATLMEEFFHLWLGHPATTVRVYQDGASRTFDRRVESEAYGSGAAALVPYGTLRQRLSRGESVRAIAEHYEVSRDLVLFRIKVTRLYGSIRRRRQ